MSGIDGRRARALAAAAIAALLLVGATGCGGGDSDGGSDGGSKSEQSSGGSGDDSSSDDDGTEAAKDMPDPCTLVPEETASELLGGETAEPESTSSDIGTESRTCTWQTQDSIDNPTLDGAGHMLTLTLIEPPGEDMSMDDFFDASAEVADEPGDVDACEKSYWMSGMLSALQDGVYLTGSAGLADDSPEAKEAATKLVTAACESLS